MKGLGYIPDEHRDSRFGFGAMWLVNDPPPSVDYTSYLDRVLDQGSTNACVGCAFSSAIYLTAAIAKVNVKRPSPKWIYDLARLQDAPAAALVDDGCRPTRAAEGLMKWGICAEERWSLAEPINDPPPWDAFQAGADSMLSAFQRIGPDGAANELRRALAAGHIPVFGMPVDNVYFDLSSNETYAGLSEPERGRHMQCILGYRDDLFMVLNSWGTSWADAGIALIHESWIEDVRVSDRIVINAVPPVIY